MSLGSNGVSQKLIGVLQVIMAGICFGFLGIFARTAYLRGISAGELVSLRFATAAIVLWIGLFFVRPQLIRLEPKQILISCLLGIFGYAVFSTLYFKSIEGVSVPLAAMLLFTFPLFVNLGAHFILKERMSSVQVICLVLASFGLVFLLWGDISVQKTSAIFCGLGAAITYSIYVLVSGKLQAHVPPLSSSLYVITAAAVSLCIYHHPPMSHLLMYRLKDWELILGLGVICTIAPLTLFLAGLQKMKSSKASVLVMVEPVTATVASGLFLREGLSPMQMVGAVLVLAGVLLDARSK
jgi:drug/metabolite transporter (DMT)-like permease